MSIFEVFDHSVIQDSSGDIFVTFRHGAAARSAGMQDGGFLDPESVHVVALPLAGIIYCASDADQTLGKLGSTAHIVSVRILRGSKFNLKCKSLTTPTTRKEHTNPIFWCSLMLEAGAVSLALF